MALIRDFFGKVSVFLEMIKFEHSIFALPFAYLGLFLAENGWPRIVLFLWVTVAMVSFRTMGMALNRLVDASIDALNPRTQNRALPAKKISFPFVWLAVFCSFAIFELSALKLGRLCFFLSPIPVFLAVIYPWTKRFTWFSHFILGIILGIAPYGAWLASRAEFSWVPGLMMLGVASWVAGFDVIYALQDEEFDREQGLYSFPVRFGFQKSLILTQILHVVTLSAWLAAGWLAGLGWIYLLGMLVVTVFLLREHWLVRSFGIKKLGEAFFSMNAIVSVAVLVATVADYCLGGFGS